MKLCLTGWHFSLLAVYVKAASCLLLLSVGAGAFLNLMIPLAPCLCLDHLSFGLCLKVLVNSGEQKTAENQEQQQPHNL